jgi:hypothetical protein
MCGMAAVFGAIVLAGNLVGFWLDERVRAWPTTPAQLSSVEIGRDEIGVWHGRFSSTPIRERRFHVRYSYVVAGQPHVGNQIGAHGAAARVDGRPDRYAVGQRVTAHYNPSDPDEAVLETPFPSVAVLGIILGLGLLGVAVYIYLSRLPRR